MSTLSSGQPEGPPGVDSGRATGWRQRPYAVAIGAGALAGAVIVGALGWAISGSDGGATTGTQDPDPQVADAGGVTVAPTPGVDLATPSPAESPDQETQPSEDSPGSTSGGREGGGRPSGEDTSGPMPAGPRIEVFRAAQQPRCPAGTDVNPIEGQPVVLEWQVVGADEVSLAVDGPGLYASYDPDGNGGETFSFACAGSEGDVERHTYQLTATGGGRTVTEELVVEAVVHERADVGGEGD